MSPEAWTFLTGLTGLAAGLWREQRRTRKQVEANAQVIDRTATAVGRAATAAGEAAELARPTGNGFANRVEDGLHDLVAGQSDLKAAVASLAKRLDRHIDDHASADVRRQD